MDDLPAILVAAAIASAAYIFTHDFHVGNAGDAAQMVHHKIAGSFRGCMIPIPGGACASTHH
ncbi:MAG TPA: hypothetical protein VFK15_12795 [Burkholderiales bacterium]|jgi:hypothetical protein|nr:hypothetical protein [Burkholderiales bacterium]